MILTSAEKLTAGKPYTFTFSHGRVIEYNSADEILSALRQIMGSNYGEVLTVDRPLFSTHYVITVIPKSTRTLSEWIKPGYGFDWAFKHLGYSGAVFIQAEGGETSSKAGGLSEAIPNITGQVSQVASDTITAVVKPLILPIALGLGIFLFLTFKK